MWVFAHPSLTIFLLHTRPALIPDNCGDTDHLYRCSRCRTAWFCGRACQKVRGERGRERRVCAGGWGS